MLALRYICTYERSPVQRWKIDLPKIGVLGSSQAAGYNLLHGNPRKQLFLSQANLDIIPDQPGPGTHLDDLDAV